MLEHRIRLRAYDLYLEGGKRSGRALEDWLKAEREVLRELQAYGSGIRAGDREAN
jgi:hypothetical protein